MMESERCSIHLRRFLRYALSTDLQAACNSPQPRRPLRRHPHKHEFPGLEADRLPERQQQIHMLAVLRRPGLGAPVIFPVALGRERDDEPVMGFKALP